MKMLTILGVEYIFPPRERANLGRKAELLAPGVQGRSSILIIPSYIAYNKLIRYTGRLMAEKSGDRLLVTGVTQQELEFALGFVGLYGYKIELVTEPEKLGLATMEELKQYAIEVETNPQLATKLSRRVREFHPHLITDTGSIELDGLAEAIKNADRWFAGGKKTLEFAQSFIDSKTKVPESE